MSYFKRGGLHFIKLGRFGASFYLSKHRKAVAKASAKLGHTMATLEPELRR